MRLATLILCLAFAAPAVADGIVYWPATGERVYVITNPAHIGAYGRMTKPRGVDRIVVQVGSKWGTVPPSLYNSKPAPAKPGYRYGRIR